ncbi:hypothetical protein [Fimbriiglobus ruber]|uniref:Uncharacterized protein n=1 Tax=Fimbriiglobus ruber TaxID=1908690 RepID=A0A225DY30_9BACT|nr:hypothetical protein [Fimbriiglobus ruber]OWK41255.1 hypothetical protein FRUB_04618 [Fimbriiglobus ruber]
MAKVVFYRQCQLVKPIPTGEMRQVAWIPDKFATAGKEIRLREPDKSWNAGWIVAHVGRTKLAEADLPDFHQDSKAHLRASGDAETAAKRD